MGRSRRKTAWHGKKIDYVSLSVANNTVQLVSSNTLHGTTQDPTIIRIVGRLLFMSERDTDTFIESARTDAWVGINCHHEDVTAQSVRDNPEAEGWMWTSFLHVEQTKMALPYWNGSAEIIKDTTQHIPQEFAQVEFDIRAMRKAPEPCEINLMVHLKEQMTNTVGGHFISGLVRVLVKE